MKIFSRYIFKEIFAYFLISLFTFTGILLTVRILKFTNLIVNRGVQTSQIAMVFLSIIPTFLEIAIPMASLLGVMMAFARLSGDSEIIVVKASGISLLRLLTPILIFGSVTLLLGFFVSHNGRPWGYRKLASTFFEIARTRTTAGLEPGSFNKLGKLTLYSETIDHQSGKLNRVLVDDRRSETERKVIFAERGRILSQPEKQTITFVLYDGTIHELIGEQYTLTRFQTNNTVMDADELYDPDVSEKNIRDRARSNSGLNKRLEYLRDFKEKLDAGEKLPDEDITRFFSAGLAESRDEIDKTSEDFQKLINKVEVEKARRWSMPFAALLLALVGMPLGIQPPRTQKTWGAGLSLSLGFLVFVFYYALLSIGVTMAEKGTLPATIALWIPNVCTLLAASTLLYGMGTERWQSLLEAVDSLLLSIPFLKKKGDDV